MLLSRNEATRLFDNKVLVVAFNQITTFGCFSVVGHTWRNFSSVSDIFHSSVAFVKK